MTQVATRVQELFAALRDPDTTFTAQLELLRMGPDVAAPLARLLTRRSNGQRAALDQRWAAVRVLEELGPLAADAAPILWDCARDSTSEDLPAQCAARVLTWTAPFCRSDGGRIRKELREVDWQHPKSSVHRMAVGDLGTVHLMTSFDVTGMDPGELLALARTESILVAVTAARELWLRWRADPANREVAAECFEALIERDLTGNRTDDARWCRTAAAVLLADIDPRAPGTYLGHCQRLFALDPSVRIQAARDLAALEQPRAARWLLDAAWAGPSEFSVEALQAIQALGPRALDHRYRLVEFLDHPEPTTAAAARLTLGLVAPEMLDEDRPPPVLEIAVVGVGDLSIDAESRRLVAWLNQDGGVNRQHILDDPRYIETFHERGSSRGGPVSEYARWVPVRRQPSILDIRLWNPIRRDLEPWTVVAAPATVCGPTLQNLAPDRPWIVDLVLTDRRHTIGGDQVGCREIQSNGATLEIRTGSARALLTEAEWRASVNNGSVLYLVDDLVVSAQSALQHAWRAQTGYMAWVHEPNLDRMPALRRAGQ